MFKYSKFQKCLNISICCMFLHRVKLLLTCNTKDANISDKLIDKDNACCHNSSFAFKVGYVIYITQICPCNILQYFTAMKIIIFR